jgi:hypothetical protein
MSSLQLVAAIEPVSVTGIHISLRANYYQAARVPYPFGTKKAIGCCLRACYLAKLIAEYDGL